MLRIGNAQAFWGDSPGAPARLIQLQPDLDYLTLDYLSEVSMSIMAIQKEKNPNAGYAKDFLDVVRSLIPFWLKGLKFKLVANAGGLSPIDCGLECQKILNELKCNKKIGVVSGDNVLHMLQDDSSCKLFRNLETNQPLEKIKDKLVTANAYLGAQPIASALNAGAEIVITGRIADPSLTVGPCISHFKWSKNDYNRIAGATVAGHLIECGTQVTGGVCTNWLQIPDPTDIGFPIVEMDEDGSCVVTKPPKTGGRVSIETVKEQLLYEIGDPAAYLSPDATVSFLSLSLSEEGPNRIRVTGATGSAPPDNYKVSATYRDGFKTEGSLAVFGIDAKLKARRCGEIILERVKKAGYELDHSNIECFSNGAIVPKVLPDEAYPDSMECYLRISVSDKREAALECFSKEIAGLVTSGPQGVTGYTSGRPRIRSVFGYWPCLVERKRVDSQFQIL